MRAKHIYRQGPYNERYGAGIGYLVIPSNTDRGTYIQRALRLGKVMVLSKNGDIALEVRIGRHLYNELEFPDNNQQLGSAIVWVNIPVSEEIIAIAILNKDDDARQFLENEFQLIRSVEGATVSVTGKGEEGQLFINVHTERATGGEVYINVDNKAGTGKLKVEVKGDVDINTIGKINLQTTNEFNIKIIDLDKDKKETLIQYKKTEGFKYVDEFENEFYINKEHFQAKPKKRVDLGEGKQPIPLGNNTKQLFSDFIDEVSKITVTTSLGVMPIMNQTAVLALKEKLAELLSKYSFTD